MKKKQPQNGTEFKLLKHLENGKIIVNWIPTICTKILAKYSTNTVQSENCQKIYHFHDQKILLSKLNFSAKNGQIGSDGYEIDFWRKNSKL